MVSLVDEALRGPLFERSAGFASADVTVADPAVGTGTFLLGVLRRIAATVTEDQGPGAVRGAIEAAAKRVIGFELQFGPFAVAQLRLLAEMVALMATPKQKLPPIPELRLYITDTLGNPFGEEQYLPQIMQPVAKSRQEANPRSGIADGALAPAAAMGRWRACQASQESLYLFLALGDVEGVRFRPACFHRPAGKG
jgi:hypothetical protein